MLKRLAIISCCALGSFAFGRWWSPPARTAAAAPAPGQSATESSAVTPANIPPPARAGRVGFADLYRSLESSSAEDHVAYLHSIQKVPAGPDRRAALTAFFQCMASLSPQAAADLVRQVGKDDIQRATEAVLAATPAANTPVLVQMLLDLPADVNAEWREQTLRGQMFFWAAFDPAAAMQFADEYRSTYPDLESAGIIQCLAATDPTAATRWMNEHPNLSAQPALVANYLQGVYQRDPAEARRYVIEHASEERVQPSVAGLARLTFLTSADDAIEFIGQLPTKEARQAALDGIIDTNAELFASKGTSRTSLYAGMAEWVTKFSPDEWPTAMPAFLSQWQGEDPNGSVSWMAQLPSATRSAVAGELVQRMSDERFKEVLATAPGDFRNDVLAAFAKRLPSAPEERTATIESLNLSPQDAAQLAAIAQ